MFDELGDKRSRNKVIVCLQEEAKDIDKIGKQIRLDRTSVFYHLKQMQKEGIVIKKFVGKRAYFGLINKYRKEVSSNSSHK